MAKNLVATTRFYRSSYLDANKIITEAVHIARAVTACKARVAIAGDAALALHGSPHLAEDVLVLADRPVDLPSNTRCRLVVRRDNWKNLCAAAIARATPISGLGPPAIAAAIPLVTPPFLAALLMQGARSMDRFGLEWMFGAPSVLDVAEARVVVREHLGGFGLEMFERERERCEWRRRREAERTEEERDGGQNEAT